MVGVKLQYQHANPSSGNESFLLRFEEAGRERTPCLLVDSGAGIDVDDLLVDEDYLVGVALTHAHLDHYRTLGQNLRDGAPVYASTETAAFLETVLSEGQTHRDLGDAAAAVDALEPLDGWHTVVGDVRIHPVAAGHAPGAAGFVVEFRDGSDPHHVLASGDFTRRRAAGYPGLDVDDVDVEAVFLAGATSESVPATLTEIVETALERGRAGSRTLLATSGLTGVHLAYLLGHAGNRVDGPPVTVVGQAAKLYGKLGYDVPTVSAAPTFESPTEVLDPGSVTIAGPEVPVDGSTARLFAHLRDDPSATLLQVTGGATDPVEDAACTVYARTLSNHPEQATVDAVVADLDPVEVVITHQSSRAADRYKDRYDALTWATDDRSVYTLYDDGWTGPPWVHESTTRAVLADHLGPRLDPPDRLTTPTRGEVDLGAEGLDWGALRARFAGRSAGRRNERAHTEAGGAADGGVTDAGGPGSDDEALAGVLDDIDDRLSAIERAVGSPADGPSLRARVVDVGDGVTLLRVLDADTDLSDGDELHLVTVHGSGEDTGGGSDE